MRDNKKAEQELLREWEELAKEVQEGGVLGYLKPTRQPRKRVNSTFLVNTICNMEQANRRTEENMMWAKRRSELGLGNQEKEEPVGKGKGNAPEDIAGRSIDSMAYLKYDCDSQRSKVKGRGSIGSVADVLLEQGIVVQHEGDSGKRQRAALPGNEPFTSMTSVSYSSSLSTSSSESSRDSRREEVRRRWRQQKHQEKKSRRHKEHKRKSKKRRRQDRDTQRKKEVSKRKRGEND